MSIDYQLQKEELNELSKYVDNYSIAPESIVFIMGSYLSNDITEFRRLEISKGLAYELIKMLQYSLNELQSKVDRILTYDPGYNQDINEIEYINLYDKYLSNIINKLPTTFNIAPFQSDEKDFISNARFYLITINQQSEPIYFFYARKKMKSILKNTRLAIRLFGDSFDTLEDQIFLLDKNIDCIIFKNIVYIINKNNFHEIFNYYDGLKEEAKCILNEIREKVVIFNYSDFMDACLSNKNMLSILLSIKQRGYLKTMSTDRLVKVINENGINIEIIYENGKPQLKYNKDDKYAILRLLNDDYLKSVMTEIRYEVNSKREL